MATRCLHSEALWSILALMVLSVLLPAQEGGRDEAAEARRRREGIVARIPKPADREAVSGKFEMVGETFEISEGRLYDTLVLLTRLEGGVQNRPNTEAAWTHIMLLTLAEQLGIDVPESALDARLRRDMPEIYEGVVARWEAAGVSREEAEALERARLRISRLKDFMLESERISTRDAFDQFKVNRLLYQVEYITFSGADREAEMRADGISDDDLEAYWKSNPGVQARFRLPARVSGTIVYLDPSEYDAEAASKLADGGEVDRAQALAYFQANRDRLVASIPPAKRHLLTISEDTPIEEVVSPFELVRPDIEKKLALEHLIQEAFAEAIRKPEMLLPALAKKHHLKTVEFEDLSRNEAMASLRRFGIAAFTQLFSAPEGMLSPRVSVFEDVRFFFRIKSKQQSTVPEFADVKEELRELYFELSAAEQAQADARAFVERMNRLVAEEISGIRKELREKADREADERIKALGLEGPSEQARERARTQSRMRLELDGHERKARPKVFSALVEEEGMQTRTTPLFEFDLVRQDRNAMTDAEESRLAFFRSSHQLRGLKKGEVTAMPLEDHILHEFHVARLTQLRDPELSTMGPVDLIQARSQLEQITLTRFPRAFAYAQLADRFGLVTF